MNNLISLINTLFSLCLILGLLLSGLLMLVSPQRARQVLKRLMMAVLLWLLAICALRQLNALWQELTISGGAGMLLLLGIVISVVAYFVYKIRHRQPKKPPELRGAERTPLLPQHYAPHLNEERQKTTFQKEAE